MPLEYFLQLSRVPGQLPACLPSDHELNQQFADSVPFEIEGEPYARPFAAIQRFNRAVGTPHDWDVADAAEPPALRRAQLGYHLGRWPLAAADPPVHHCS